MWNYCVLSVNSWRCAFYFFAFVYGVLALYDVSSLGLFPSIIVFVSMTGFVSCVSQFWINQFFALQLFFGLSLCFSPSVSRCSCTTLISLCAACESAWLSPWLMSLCASGIFSHSQSWHGRQTCMSSWQLRVSLLSRLLSDCPPPHLPPHTVLPLCFCWLQKPWFYNLKEVWAGFPKQVRAFNFAVREWLVQYFTMH